MFGDPSASEKHPLTRRQQDALDAITAHVSEVGRAPTYRELADRLSVRSVTSAVKLVEQLERKGHIEVEEGTARGIRLVGAGGDVPSGRMVFVAEAASPRGAGWPAPKQGYWVDSELLPPEADGQPLAYITMPDDSMQRDGIQKHDIVVGWPERSDDVPSGALIIHALDRQFTVRRLQRYGERLLLTAADPLTPRSELRSRPSRDGKAFWPMVGRAGIVIRRRL